MAVVMGSEFPGYILLFPTAGHLFPSAVCPEGFEESVFEG